MLLVQLEGRWLADVGFGDSFEEPLRLDEPGVQLIGGRGYRVSRAGDDWRMDQRFDTDGLAEGFLFTLEARQLDDFARQCRAFQVRADSPFRRGHICSRATPVGRVTVSDRRLIITEDGERTERSLQGEDEVAAAIAELFGFDLAGIGSAASG